MKSVGFHVSSRGAHCGKMKQKKKRANLPKVLLAWNVKGNQYAPPLFLHPADLIKLCLLSLDLSAEKERYNVRFCLICVTVLAFNVLVCIELGSTLYLCFVTSCVVSFPVLF